MALLPNMGKGDTEQFPLLKVESGVGDAELLAAGNRLQSGVVKPKRKKCACWWPELVLVCWITLVLFVVGLIAFMVASSGFNEDNIRKTRQIECLRNDSPQVFYYQIVNGGQKIRFKQYSEYLSETAALYPHLCFNVLFLEDDSTRSVLQGARNTRLYNRLFLNNAPSWSSKMSLSDLHVLNAMLIKYHNINVTVSTLSCFMMKTPIKDRWRTVPMTHLDVYLRANAVWQNGGIALDLDKYSNYYMHRYDAAIANVFEQLNEDLSCKMRFDDENSFCSMLSRAIYQLWYNSETLYNNTYYVIGDKGKARDPNEPVIRTHRNKRNDPVVVLDADLIDSKLNTSTVSSIDTTLENKNGPAPAKETNASGIILPEVESTNTIIYSMNEANEMSNISIETTDKVKWLYFYDLQIYSQPYGELSDDVRRSELINKYVDDSTVTIAYDSKFIASACRAHPFLGRILTSVIFKSSSELSIEHIYHELCSGNIHHDFCASVRFI